MNRRSPEGWRWLLILGLILSLMSCGTAAQAQSAAPKVQSAAPKTQPVAPKAQPSQKKGQPGGPLTPEPEVPLHITSNTMEADQEKHLILFKGQVKAVHGDATLYADELWVYYKPKEEGMRSAPAGSQKQEDSPLGDLGGDKLDRIEAKGNVRFVQEDKVAIGREGIYKADKDEIVLTGDPQVWQGENHLRGDKITYNRKTRRVLVESSTKQRVEAHLYQKGQEGAKPPPELVPKGKPGEHKIPKGYKPLPR